MSTIEEYKTNVIETGLSLLSTNTSNIDDITLAKLQMKEFGLSMILLGLAEKCAERVSRLQKVVDKLEEELFDSHLINALDEDQKVERYNMANDTISSSASYIKATINNINWNDLELRMQQIRQNDISSHEESESGIGSGLNSNNPRDLKDIANKLLEEFK